MVQDQGLPGMTAYKVGQIFYWISIDPDNGQCSFEEHHVRTIRGGEVHAILKDSFTWGKRSSKNGDFGWLKNIPAWCRRKWPVDGKPHGKFTTKRQAVLYELKRIKPENFDDEKAYDRAMKALRTMKART